MSESSRRVGSAPSREGIYFLEGGFGFGPCVFPRGKGNPEGGGGGFVTGGDFISASALTISARVYPRGSVKSERRALAPNVVVLDPTPMLNCPVALVVSADRQVRRLISASLGQIGCTSLDV